MNVGRTICLVVILTAAGTLHAENCSGGPDGGTDATGNQCNDAPDSVKLARVALGTH